MAAIALPDLSGADPSVRDQIRQTHQALEHTIESSRDSAERGSAFGELGVLLHAAEYLEAAEPAYRNAERLMTGEPKWPYLLARLYKTRGQTDASEAALLRVLELRPDSVPALIWLARLRLERGDAADAEQLFTRAQNVAPHTVAALAGLGQTALARKDFTRAIALLEDALRRSPSAESLHSPLAMAYRGVGNVEKAEWHIRQWSNTEVPVPDPWRQELDLALESGLSYELRGIRALEARDFKAAAEFFSQGAALAPETTGLGRSLRHKLGTALFLAGDIERAVGQFEQVVRAAPPPAAGADETASRAHYSLGVLAASSTRDADAIEHLQMAVQYSPSYVEARQALADTLRRAGRLSDALPQYAEILSLDPTELDARYGYAMALVAQERYRDARTWLEDARQSHPEDPRFGLALARLLAAAPDAHVRDGRRALAIVDELLAGERTVELGEATAMALAEVGDFAQAAAVQRQVMEAATAAGLQVDRSRLRADLRRYESGAPSRTVWPADHPALRPPPPVASLTGSLLAATPPSDR
jgi:tetratricopeptide (TPR) repeat protein